MRIAFFFTLLALATVSVSAQWRFVPDTTINGWSVTNSTTATTGNAVNPTWTVVAGTVLTFSLETNNVGQAGHPLGFAAPATAGNAADAVGASGNAGCTNGTAANTFFQTTSGTPCIVTVTAPAAGTTWQYRCNNHAAMRGNIVSVAADASSSSSSSTGAAGGASSSSSSSSTTPVVASSSSSSSAVTTPAPTRNGTASVAMPALTVVLATITAAAIVA